jgi:hypothetical protein
MDYQTRVDIVAQEQARLRTAMRWVLPALGLALLGLAFGLVGHRTGSRALGLAGFGLGAAAVLLGGAAVVRAGWAFFVGVIRRK